jgi:TRAP-type C4-dicarboxylate transport system substrate-binding protein
MITKRRLAPLFVAMLFALPAHAQPDFVLRLATIAPDGTPWARELKAYARNLESATDGHLRVKVYYGGVAGDELEQEQRIQRGQLDGSMSGGMLCERVAPSMVVARLPAMFQNREEAIEVLNNLEPILEAEAHRAGYAMPATSAIGSDALFTRVPVHSMDDLRRLKLWHWAPDEVGIASSRAMGLQIVPLPIYEGARAYDDGRVDGFFAVPSAAMAFQWSTRARYVADLRRSYIFGCVLFSERFYSRLPAPMQEAIRSSTAVLRERFAEVGRQVDEALLGGMFAKQGVTVTPVSERFRAEYFNAARAARGHVAETLVPRALIDRVLNMLADYRAEHATEPPAKP